MKCFECNGTYQKKDYEYELCGVSLCKVKALVCNKCGDLVLNEAASDKIEKAAKKKGLWGLKSRTRVGQVGNSLDVKINKRLAEFMNIKKGTEVNVYPESDKRLVVEIE